MKRILSLLLAMALLSLAACGQTSTGTGTTPAGTAPGGTAPAQTTPPPTNYPETDNLISFLTLSLGEDAASVRSITVYPNDDGTVHVEYVGEVKKIANLDANVLHGITTALSASGLGACNGQDAWTSGNALGSMYVSFADGSVWSAGYGGTVPATYRQAYGVMDTFLAELTAHLPVYVPQPLLLGPVEDKYLEELDAIFREGGVQDLDAFTVDGSLSYSSLGLTSGESILSSAYCTAMMMTTPYSLVIVTLKDGADARNMCEDFKDNLDWTKWVCVLPSNALIATKDNMVLCLMGSDRLYAQTVSGIEASGWTVYRTLKRPSN